MITRTMQSHSRLSRARHGKRRCRRRQTRVVGPHACRWVGLERLERRVLLSADQLTFSGPFEPIEPLGAHIYRQSVIGHHASSGEQDQIALHLDANQTVTIVGKPPTSGRMMVELIGPGSVSLGSAASTSTLVHGEDFEDGVADAFDPVSGTWQVTPAGRYAVTVGVGLDGVSTVDLSEPLPLRYAVEATVVGLDAGSDSFSNAVVIFDYRGPDDYKFAGAFFGANKWRIGHVDASGMHTDILIADNLELGTEYAIQVVARGSKATLLQDGAIKTQFDFGEPINNGVPGVGVFNAWAEFDEVAITVVHDAVLQTVAANEAGEYTIEVTSIEGIGDYEAQVLLNPS